MRACMRDNAGAHARRAPLYSAAHWWGAREELGAAVAAAGEHARWAPHARGAAQVEPFSRALRELNVDCMVNGRRRDHGFDRAHLEARPAEPRASPLCFGGRGARRAEEHAELNAVTAGQRSTPR